MALQYNPQFQLRALSRSIDELQPRQNDNFLHLIALKPHRVRIVCVMENWSGIWAMVSPKRLLGFGFRHRQFLADTWVYQIGGGIFSPAWSFQGPKQDFAPKRPTARF
jgi:hypothetical protein